MKIGLLGGGITSLAIGYFLKKPYEILEKEDRCGGLCQSLIDKGYTFDYHGAHILFSKNKTVLELEKKLVGPNLKYQLRISKIYFKGKLVKYPFENGLGEFDPQDNYECLYHYLFDKFPKPKNLEDWFYDTFGTGISNKYLIPYNRKIWKTEPQKMGMEWVERIPKPPKEDVIKSSLGISTEGYKHQLNFLYPNRGGVEALIKAFAKNNKGEITLNFEVQKIYKTKNGWLVSSGSKQKEYNHVVSTLPIFEVVKMLKNIKVPKSVIKAANALEYRALITVMLGLNKPKLTNLVAIYFPDEDFFPHRVYKNMQVTKYAYPVYDLYYQKNMKILKAFLSSINLHICGRFGGFEYINTDVCIESAQKLASELNQLPD
ncbi:FAD-dependent oxidoreductase [Candidatus Gottesmanbacteria bacterium]|nr:FAD-dependent oxidoreductase [Candidatus Gottesmanbacteria bacterium]